ncbi:MAG: hypothetical protein A2268_15075 [Candidatus Raymondbacteria bacterium RifOxyA12_full_50_37]|nr:MAG: hypothetical protein A2268_15075 [Candidatus Raymondbacteria bacterium RifOxyA12_full_50_37]OGJ88551.1 MAG: hypothetical protein A2248_20185 [Candidatus Raymondbacteria bacterium RIFOXYA2_FULL_49_16]OGJ99010.1 MAG: hypothetical protein A2453_10905 [Candidatus Raymondbacteria bacterium RIFOXYC2_FULL_50_21]OGK00642.1 MAG: hypothetical protein A2487_13750 [Candidatus Raymondbacteria bacterium RifOxyC12_full_50_8]OGP41520.1 MAG: hypothetical protein A2324_05715 [Candidatus Raymondbacteria b
MIRILFKRLDFVSGPFTYNEDGFATWDQSADFMTDGKFLNAYKVGKKTGSWIRYSEIHWRAYIVCWAANHTSHLEGDFVECGVNRGGYARAILEYVGPNLNGKRFWLLDTFEGIPGEQISKEEAGFGRKAGGYSECFEAVNATFKPFSNVQIVRGRVPETLSQVQSEKVCYLSIDMNITEPEIAAAEFFWDKLVSGAIIVLDDYNFAWHLPQRRAFDEFAVKHGVKVLALPTGQGLIFKR